MKWEDFKAEAERLGLTVFENSEFQWAGYKGSYEVQVFPKNTTFTVSTGRTNGDAADALREAARLMRGDVAVKLREWLLDDKAIAEGHLAMFGTEERHAHNRLRIQFCNAVLAKLNELEGKS